MKYIQELRAEPNPPKLIPIFKQTERQLLSVLMAALEASPVFRGRLLAPMYRSGRTCSYRSMMEPSYSNPAYPEVRPDGLIVCKRGTGEWACFVEAKANKDHIRTEQIQNYLDLGKRLGVSTVLTISNEFARAADEPPYAIAQKHRKGLSLFHFSWADIRTQLAFALAEEQMSASEVYLLSQVLEFLWSETSGVATYDAMPALWKDFVESAATTLGFGPQQKGLAEIVHGWQQERRDLASKLLAQDFEPVQLKHHAGARASEDERTKFDRNLLAEDYMLSALYHLRERKVGLEVALRLRSCSIEVAVDIPLPDGKGARSIINWLNRSLDSSELQSYRVSIDWPGRGGQVDVQVSEFGSRIEELLAGQKAAPKSVRVLAGTQNTRRFKSRKFVITDLEDLVLGTVANLKAAKLI